MGNAHEQDGAGGCITEATNRFMQAFSEKHAKANHVLRKSHGPSLGLLREARAVQHRARDVVPHVALQQPHVEEAAVASVLAGEVANRKLAMAIVLALHIEDDAAQQPFGMFHRPLRLGQHRLQLHDRVQGVQLAPGALGPEDELAAVLMAQELLPEAERHGHERLRD